MKTFSKDFEDDEEEWKIFNEAVREIVTVNKNKKYKKGLRLLGTRVANLEMRN
ncbi:hypothetical protein SO802_007504 [Lithocarpus litseifolius]|uniref:Uncharacterized protein n=1 Tax=Lithocarpus litseifolius TaxID=425828 RepID=A0AAW2DUH5_9ROSI